MANVGSSKSKKSRKHTKSKNAQNQGLQNTKPSKNPTQTSLPTTDSVDHKKKEVSAMVWCRPALPINPHRNWSLALCHTAPTIKPSKNHQDSAKTMVCMNKTHRIVYKEAPSKKTQTAPKVKHPHHNIDVQPARIQAPPRDPQPTNQDELKQWVDNAIRLYIGRDYGGLIVSFEINQKSLMGSTRSCELNKGYSLFFLAVSLYKLGRANESLRWFEELLKLNPPLSKYRALIFATIGDCNQALKKIDSALKAYKQALNDHKTSPNETPHLNRLKLSVPTLSALYLKLVACYKQTDNRKEVIKAYIEATKAADQSRDLDGQMDSYVAYGNYCQTIGLVEESIDLYKKSLEVAKKTKSYVRLSWIHGNIGNAYILLQKKELGLKHLKDALELSVKYEQVPTGIGRCYNNLGTAYQSLNELKLAQEYYCLALDQAIYGEDIPGQARAMGNLGNIYILQHQYEEAVPRYTETMLTSQDANVIMTAHHNRGCCYYDWGESILDHKLPEKIKWPFRVYVARGLLEDDESVEIKEAPLIYESILKYFKQAKRDLEYVLDKIEGNLSPLLENPDFPELGKALLETNSRTFHRFIDSQTMIDLTDTASLVVAEQIRCRTMSNFLSKYAQNHQDFNLETPLSWVTLERFIYCIQKPIVYLTYTGDRLVFHVLKPSPDQQKSSYNAFYIRAAKNQFENKSFDMFVQTTLHEEISEKSIEMYKPLDQKKANLPESTKKLNTSISAILEKMFHEEIDTYTKTGKQFEILFCTCGPTGLYPLDILSLKNNNNIHLSDMCLSYHIPSISIAFINRCCRNTGEITISPQDAVFLGDADTPSFEIKSTLFELGRLPFAKKEIIRSAHVFSSLPITGRHATKNRVLSKIFSPRTKLIHLAVHGSASSGFLAFASDTFIPGNAIADSNTCLLYPKDVTHIFSKRTHPNLQVVFLSACDSSRGTIKVDGMKGMVDAFLSIGTRVVIGTLWRAPDESTQVLNSILYFFLVKQNITVSEAKNKAINAIQVIPKYSDYVHWSGIQVYGDGNVSITNEHSIDHWPCFFQEHLYDSVTQKILDRLALKDLGSEENVELTTESKPDIHLFYSRYASPIVTLYRLNHVIFRLHLLKKRVLYIDCTETLDLEKICARQNIPMDGTFIKESFYAICYLTEDLLYDPSKKTKLVELFKKKGIEFFVILDGSLIKAKKIIKKFVDLADIKSIRGTYIYGAPAPHEHQEEHDFLPRSVDSNGSHVNYDLVECNTFLLPRLIYNFSEDIQPSTLKETWHRLLQKGLMLPSEHLFFIQHLLGRVIERHRFIDNFTCRQNALKKSLFEVVDNWIHLMESDRILTIQDDKATYQYKIDPNVIKQLVNQLVSCMHLTTIQNELFKLLCTISSFTLYLPTEIWEKCTWLFYKASHESHKVNDRNVFLDLHLLYKLPNTGACPNTAKSTLDDTESSANGQVYYLPRDLYATFMPKYSLDDSTKSIMLTVVYRACLDTYKETLLEPEGEMKTLKMKRLNSFIDAVANTTLIKLLNEECFKEFYALYVQTLPYTKSTETDAM